MENNLYPLKFQPIFKSKIWGGDRLRLLLKKDNAPTNCGESWEVSGIQGDESVIANGFLKGNTLTEAIEIYMGDLVGDSIYDQFGLEFPLLIKFIDAQDDLSIQIHPNDELALQRHNSFGKTEMWYLVDCETNSKIVNGFSQKITKQQYIEKLNSGHILDTLNVHTAHKGDIFFIPAGLVHAIGKGCLVAEIQQTSDITYRIYDYERRDSNNQQRELHTEQALDAIDFNNIDNHFVECRPDVNNTATAINCKYFTTNVFRFDRITEKDFPNNDSFIIYMCMDGGCSIQYDDSKTSVKIVKGETILVPACISNLCFVPDGDTTLLEIYI